MPTEPGTFERLVLLVGDALAPLARRMEPDRVPALLAELGLAVPEPSLSPALRAAFGTVANAAADLPDLLADLRGGIDAGANGIQITGSALLVAEKAVAVVAAFDTIATEVGRLTGIPTVTPTQLGTFAADLPARLLELTLVEFLQSRRAMLNALLSLLGVVEHTRLNVGSTNPFLPAITRPSLRFGRIGDFLASPEAWAQAVYGWGDATFGPTLLDRLAWALDKIGLPVAWTTTGTPPRPALELLLARLTTTTGVNPQGLEALVTLALGDGVAFTHPLGPGLFVELAARGEVAASAAARITPPASLTVVPPGGSMNAEVTAGIAKVPVAPETTVVLFGVVGGTRVQADRLSLAVTAHVEWDGAAAQGDIGIEGRIQGGKLVISLAEADGFIGTLVGGLGLEADFDLGFGWTAGSGVYFTGSGGLEIHLPVHVALGPVEITGMSLRVGIDGAKFPIDLTADVKGALGPIAAVVERIGARATLSFPADHSGNLGVADLAVSFKPPNGVGLSLDVGVVKGGGYLFIDAERGEYAGALELEIADFLAVRAIGLITTRNPDGSPGFSLLIVITADFGTGIQLGYGFTLLAVGGILGVNRTMRLDALMEGVRTGAIESVMFPEDVVANAPRILSDLRTFFPPREGTFLVGPMLKLGWGTPTLISVSVGVIVEIPGNIAIVGILKVALPDEDAALLVLQVNFAGAIEFDKKRLYFFAALFESRVLWMTIEGEMGLLVAWGDDANFVLSVGGFHPRFTPPPLPFPSPRRVAVSIVNTDYARIRASGYFAVTSNTAQFGSHTEVWFGFSEFSIEGHMGFDALFQFSPFFFVIDISASMSLKAFGVGVFSVRLRLALEGPAPWRARGTGSVSVLFFEISADFDITWGEAADTELEPVDVFPKLTAELQKDEAWEALLPAGANLLVSLRTLGPDDAGLVLHPVGSLVVRQRLLPLDVHVDKLGNQRARDANRFRLEVEAGGGLTERDDVKDRFAVAQFQNLDDAAKLSSPAFQPLNAGLELSVEGQSLASGRMVKRTLRYEEIVIDNLFRRRRRFRGIFTTLFDHLVRGNSVARSVLSAHEHHLRQPFDDRISVRGDAFVVASSITNQAVAAEAVFAGQADAEDHLAGLVAADPALAGAVHVIPAVEAVGA